MNDRQGDDALLVRYREVFAAGPPPRIPVAGVTAVVLAFDEALRIPHFLEHHARLGIGHFIVVDNASGDDSAAILDAHPMVTRIRTSQPYSEHKAAWREVLADLYLDGRWVLFVDVDELLVFPGWPERGIEWYSAQMERRGEKALFTTMVDMYPDRPLAEACYRPGQSFLDAASWFDTGNYRLIPLEPKALRNWPTPSYRVFGGARERLFSTGHDRNPTWIDRLILKAVFPLRRGVAPGDWRRRIDRWALAQVSGSFQKLSPPNMSKVPLVRWQRGTRFPGGPHRLSRTYRMAEDWGALLHFKYFDDFADRTAIAVERGQHAAGALHYRTYNERMPELDGRSLAFRGSRQFRTARDLVSAGLMRFSADTRRMMRGSVA